MLARGTQPAAPALFGSRQRIVFVSDNPLRREAKFAYALKKAGWDVVLLSKTLKHGTDLSDYADVQYYKSSTEAVELASKTRARLFHNFSPSYDNTTLALLAYRPGKVLVDFYDYFYALSDGMPVRDNFTLDIKYQRQCIDAADGVVTPDLQLQYDRRKTRVARGKPLICFPNYCWDRDVSPLPRRSDGQIRIVQIGWMEFGQDVGSLRVTHELLRAGCHFHIYVHPGYPPADSEDFRYVFRDYIALQRDFPGLHFHRTVPSALLPHELRAYDFGFNMIDGSTFGAKWEKHNPAWLRLLASGRIFDYLDGGLATICDGNLAYNQHLFGRAVCLNGTRLILEKSLTTLLTNRPTDDVLLAARKRLSVTNNIHRLIRFYESFQR